MLRSKRGLVQQERPGSGWMTEESRYKFPYEAFYVQDASVQDSPELRLNDYWIWKQPGIFAEIEAHDNAAAQSIPTGATFTKVTVFDTNGESSNCTPDQANDKITIDHAGRYFVVGNFSAESGTANTQFDGALFMGGVKVDHVVFSQEFQTADKENCVSFSGIVDVTSSNVDLDVRVKHDSGGSVDFLLFDAALSVMYLGET